MTRAVGTWNEMSEEAVEACIIIICKIHLDWDVERKYLEGYSCGIRPCKHLGRHGRVGHISALYNYDSMTLFMILFKKNKEVSPGQCSFSNLHQTMRFVGRNCRC